MRRRKSADSQPFLQVPAGGNAAGTVSSVEPLFSALLRGFHTPVFMVALARQAMATRFEIVLHGTDPVALRAAGEEALDEIERLEDQLSLYRPASEIAGLNARAARGPVRVSPSVFALLQLARQLSAETGGAFDITIAPLVHCWGFMHGTGQLPAPSAVDAARARVGMRWVRLDERNFTVQFDREGMSLDLGAIGKGYAIERAAAILRDAGVTSALLHGGTSTVYALGHPPGADCWTVAVENGPLHGPGLGAGATHAPGGAEPLAALRLKDQALSVSAVWGKSFVAGGKTLGHVLDPRTGQPVSGGVLAAVVLPSATETDALSTALLVRGVEGRDAIARLRPGMQTFLAIEEVGQLRHLFSGNPR